MLATHRKSPNRPRELRERVHALVQQRLGSREICGRCRATLSTYADKCSADLDDRCPGFNVVEAERAKAEREVGLR
jgi:ribosomal protein L40E